MSWGIAETASELEKLKSESADYLNGLNSCGVIDYSTYSEAFDFYADLIEKAYRFAKDTNVLANDCISRQAAISAICNACGKIDCDKMDKCEKLQLPPANCSEIPNNSDTISRQAAIDAFGLSEKTRKYGGDHSGYDTRMLYEIQDILEGLPSAQPEIIRCKDCKHLYEDNKCPLRTWWTHTEDDFCSRAERWEE